MSVLNARSVGTKQTRAFLQVALRETFALAHLAKSFYDEHWRENTTRRPAFQSADTVIVDLVLRTEQLQFDSAIAYTFCSPLKDVPVGSATGSLISEVRSASFGRTFHG